MIYGIDVASYQADHFPLTVAGHRVSFSIIKATENLRYVNPRMRAQASWARSHGHVLGFYHFLHPGNAKSQAEFFVSRCDSQPGDILACDWENTSSGHASCAEKDQFIREVKRLRPDHRVILYCNVSDWKTRDTTSHAGDGLWIAQYNGRPADPSIEADWLIHQYTSTPVDTNVARFADKAAMKTWARGLLDDDQGAPATPPAKPKRPVVNLSNVVAAAKRDPSAKQGHTTHAADVKLVESALKAEKLLDAKYASDGSYGTLTKTAYAAWQRHCGYTGKAADGIPGMGSLKRLGARHSFDVKA